MLGTGECFGTGCMKLAMEIDIWWHWRMCRYGLYRAGYGKEIWWALVDVAVWSVMRGYVKEHLVEIGVCDSMGWIVPL